MKRLKYNTSKKKPECDGYKFDSRREMFRYIELKQMVNDGIICDLILQPVFKISLGGVRDSATGRMMAARKYIPDFQYVSLCSDIITPGTVVVEDVKSPSTAKESTYRLKRQLFHEQYSSIAFLEVY